uniref:Leucine-rich repeat-containing N-terminal plant-type domain-containing protein n=1 Tax=Paramoeba aestuarina TaxID=180227 RepID=A0A7S4UQY5_9EUKA
MNDQQLMENFIAGAKNKRIFRDRKRNFYDVCDWKEVECEDSNVVMISWNREWGVVDLKQGTIGLDWLPPKLRKINISDQYMEGTFNTSYLPKEIKQVYLGCNFLHGTLNMTVLPESLLVLHLDCNRFEGPIDLMHLPPKLEELELDENRIEAEVLMVDLPRTITSYAFDGNKIGKIVDKNGKEIKEALI